MDTLSKVGDRIASLLDFFDLSFFVSGAASLTMFGAWFWLASIPPLPAPTVLQILVAVPVAYAIGLANFAIGRCLRTRPRFLRGTEEFDQHFLTVLKAHNLDVQPSIASYLARSAERGTWRLYVRMWAEVRHSAAAQNSMSFLSRQWAMAAAYDGLATSALLGSGLALSLEFLYLDPGVLRWGLLAGTGVTCAAIVVVIGREAKRLQDYSMEELVATIAALNH